MEIVTKDSSITQVLEDFGNEVLKKFQTNLKKDKAIASGELYKSMNFSAKIMGNKFHFVLDMGKPINIMDLAKTMISLSGFEPEKDIPIFITGLRSGEKLTEELFDDENERLKSTDHEKIYVVEDLNHIDYKSIADALNDLEMSIQELEEKELIGKFQKLVQLNLNNFRQHD